MIFRIGSLVIRGKLGILQYCVPARKSIPHHQFAEINFETAIGQKPKVPLSWIALPQCHVLEQLRLLTRRGSSGLRLIGTIPPFARLAIAERLVLNHSCDDVPRSR
jgi:hypothetical protein